MISRLKALTQGPKSLLRYWMRHQEVVCRNKGAFISFPVAFTYDDVSAIKLSSGVIIDPFSEIVVRANSSYSSVSGRLTIAERVVVGSHANIRAAGGEIFIGEDSLIAQHVSLIASGHMISLEKPYRDLPWSESKTGVFIGRNVWVGANVTILPGCSIGDNSVIGAGSVVTKFVPSNEIWAGVPAKKLKEVVDAQCKSLRR